MTQIQASQAGSAQPAATGNRRAIVRYRCAPATVGKVYYAADHEFQRAWILDLSRKGIGIELCRPLQAGHLILITIRGNDGKVRELSGRIIHCEALPPDHWSVGCELLAPLSPDELEQLL